MHTFSDTVAFFPYKTVSVCVDLVKHTTEKRLATVFLGRFLVSVSSSALNKSGGWTKYDLDVFLSNGSLVLVWPTRSTL